MPIYLHSVAEAGIAAATTGNTARARLAFLHNGVVIAQDILGPQEPFCDQSMQM